MYRWLGAAALVLLTPALWGEAFSERLVAAARERTHHWVVYDGRYRAIDYPGGDVPAHIGVCTDVIVRSYRALGVDLQVLVHRDMAEYFDAYPALWGLTRPDSNIDHRRVPNLQTFFERHGTVLPVSDRPRDYRPGDIVTWKLPGNRPHIGIVSDRLTRGGLRPLVIHNRGLGPREDDALMDAPITGRYRFQPE